MKKSPWRPATLHLVFVVLGSLSLPCTAINRCTDAQGRVTYQDGVCAKNERQRSLAGLVSVSAAGIEHAALAPVPMSPADAKANTRAGSDPAPMLAASVTSVADMPVAGLAPMNVQIKKCGRVLGTSAENNCRFSGHVTAGLDGGPVSFDASMSGCDDVRLNTRYSGQLTASTDAPRTKAFMRLSSPPSATAQAGSWVLSTDVTISR